MHRPHPRFVLYLATLALAYSPTSAGGALSPGKIKQMKEESTDVVEVVITKVKVTATNIKAGYARKEIAYEAVVTAVKRSKSGTKADDRITIQSYRLSGLLPPGPKNPPVLEAGWKGTVYLDKVDGNDQFRISVFGHSFEAAEALDSE